MDQKIETAFFNMKNLIACLFLILLASCTPTRCNYCVYGANEFVTDSYKIRQGKLAIQEMLGEEAVDLDDLDYDPLAENRDFICEDDVISLAIYHPSRTDLVGAISQINSSIGFRVRNGKIQIPDISTVEVAGLTLDEARDRIQQRFEEEIQDVDVFIAYQDRFQRKVDLTGHVSVSTIPVNGKTRLYDVISSARVSPTSNLYRSYVLRDGRPLAIDIHGLMNKGDMNQNIVMRGGDKIYIADPVESQAVVMGEVGCPVAVNLPYGSISLKQALVYAGGIPYTGNRNCIQVIRGGLQCPKIYQLHWCHITHLPNESLLIMPGDTVFVSEKPITQWNRFISQLLPSLTCFQTGFDCYGSFR